MVSLEHSSIQNWFVKNLPQKVEKEVPIKGLNERRLDITLKPRGLNIPEEALHIAVEIQCSPIKIEEIRERNLDITLNGYYPIWVFGRTFYQKARRPWNRYGVMISKAEKYIHDITGSLLYHNKYDIFLSKFTYKWDCEFKGWHSIDKLSITDFLLEVQRIYVEEKIYSRGSK